MVLGGTGGIGVATAMRPAHAGATVVVTGQSDAAKAAAGGRFAACKRASASSGDVGEDY